MLFTFIETHPTAPAVLARYLQLAFNAAIFLGVLYVMLSIWQAIRSDVDKASEEAASEQLAEIGLCAKNYLTNHCNSPTRVPALESVCNNWDLCMHRDPNAVKRAALSAHTFAQILNSFVEPISIKTMVSLSLCILQGNLLTQFLDRCNVHDSWKSFHLQLDICMVSKISSISAIRRSLSPAFWSIHVTSSAVWYESIWSIWSTGSRLASKWSESRMESTSN